MSTMIHFIKKKITFVIHERKLVKILNIYYFMKIQNTHTCLLSALLSILLPFCSWYQNLYFLVDFHLWSMQSVLGFISRLTSKNVYPGPSRLSFLYICGVRLLRLHTVAKTYNVGVIFCNILSRGTDTFLDQRPR